MSAIVWWTPDRIAAMAAMAAEGRQAPEIARLLSRKFHRKITAQAVRKAAQRFGFPLRKGAPKK